MKKNYQKPAMMAVKVETTSLLDTSVRSNVGITMGGAGGSEEGSTVARGRQSSSWDDDDEY